MDNHNKKWLEKVLGLGVENTGITIEPPKPYPLHITLNQHPFIEEMEISAANYIRVKIYGTWAKIYLPSRKDIELLRRT